MSSEVLLRIAGDLPGHPFHGNQWTDSSGIIEPVISGPSATFKTDAGALEAKLEAGSLTIRESFVKESERGKGEGTKLYVSAARYAQKNGLALHSSHAVSVSADRAWSSLQKRGFSVERKKDVELDTSLNKFYAIKEMHGIQVRTGEPVWESTWKVSRGLAAVHTAHLLVIAARRAGTLRSLDDCGTGAGGFQPGNTCAKGGEGGTISAEDLRSQFKDLPRSFTGNYRSDTAIELTAPNRTTEERRDEFARIGAVSNRDAALRAMDSEKQWGTGWAAATDEWEAAQALGASDSMSKTTRDTFKEKRTGSTFTDPEKPLSEKGIAAFRERQAVVLEQLHKEHPSGEVTLYRGIKGAQAKKLEGSVGDQVDLGVHGLSSWSTRRSVADEFSGKRGRILSTTTKIEDIWTTGERVMQHQIIRYSDQRGEYVLKTSGKSRKVTVVR